MARLTKKDWQKLQKTTMYKGQIVRPTPRWVPSRKGQRTASAWTKKLGDRLKES